MSPTAQSIREKKIARRHAIITSAAAAVGAITGVIALLVSFSVAGEPARSEQRLAEDREGVTSKYLSELVGTSSEALDRARSKATVGSDADHYAEFLREVWLASETYLPDSEFSAGRSTRVEEANEYKVCLPKTAILSADCMTFGNSQFNESESLISSFTIDDLPVRSLLVRGNTSNGVLDEPDNADFLPWLGSGSSGWLKSPDNSSSVLVLYIKQLWSPERSGSDLRTLYLSAAPVRVLDELSNELTVENLLPRSVGPYESKYIVFKVANGRARYVQICGYMDGVAEHCWWVEALPPPTPS